MSRPVGSSRYRSPRRAVRRDAHFRRWAEIADAVAAADVAAGGGRVTPVGWAKCDRHRKRAWPSRDAALVAWNRMPDRRRLNVYPCTAWPGHFHIGHLPAETP